MKISEYDSGVGAIYSTEKKKQSDIANKKEQQMKINGVSKNENKVKKKKLNYKYREVSTAIRQCKKYMNASLVVTKAKSTLGNLQKSKGSGQYDEAELENAIVHAKKMVRCARMKAGNLKQEEQSKNRGTQEKTKDRMKFKRTGRGKKRKDNAEEEMILQQRIKNRERSLKEVCRDNRMKERKKLDEADLEYLKRKLELLSKNESSSDIVSQANSDYDMNADMAYVLGEVNTLEAAEAAMVAETAAESVDVSL